MDVRAIAVMDANFHWTQELFSPLAERVPLLFLQPHVWRAPVRKAPPKPNIEARAPAYPPGWMLRWPRPFHAHLSRLCKRWWPVPSGRVAVFTYPQYWRAARHSGADRTVYYWSDEFRSYWGADKDEARRRRIIEAEHAAVHDADLTITASREKALQLRMEVPARADRIKFLVHGHHPSLDLPPPPPAPELAGLARPILGHWGQVSNHLDIQAALEVAQAHPTGTLVFVGPIRNDFDAAQRPAWERLRELPNVRFIPSQAYKRIAAFLVRFDVALALYRPTSPFAAVANPSKIRDYLAAGIPVASTALPDVRHFWGGLVHVAARAQDFASSVANALSEGSAQRRARHRYAANHTWPLIAARLWRLITDDALKDGLE